MIAFFFSLSMKPVIYFYNFFCSTRDRLIEFWNDTNQTFHEKDPKRVYYLSIEFLMGRTLQNALINLDLTGPYATALTNLGYKLEELVDQEYDAALGNGGLGTYACVNA